MKINGNLVDIFSREIYPAEVVMRDGKIESVNKCNGCPGLFIMPGLIDAHIHIESSLCTPGAFAVQAVSRGTTAVVSDPHEIANVLGIEGVRYMIADSRKVPLKFFFGAPSCVPATNFETAGASITAHDIETLLRDKNIKYLAEMMNYPGVVNGDSQVMSKIKSAVKHRKPVDGHAPGLTGKSLIKYTQAGISTDHECTEPDEAREKIGLGMKILIREGSAARNLEALKEIIRTNPGNVMLCSDDLHPEMLMERHLNSIVARLVNENFDLYDVIRSCTLNPAIHYSLDAGMLRPGDPADFILVDNPRKMTVLETWIEGKKTFDRGRVLFSYEGPDKINRFNCSRISEKELVVKKSGNYRRVIGALDGDLLTKHLTFAANERNYVESDTVKDILKIVVKDRYNDNPPAVGFINGFAMKRGALASSVSHDSHNIISVGVNDQDIAGAINEIVRLNGGLAVADGADISSLPLPVAGIMSDKPVADVALKYSELTGRAHAMGCNLKAPFMTLSFMALLVIPELKLSDRGLFDAINFRFVSLFEK